MERLATVSRVAAAQATVAKQSITNGTAKAISLMLTPSSGSTNGAETSTAKTAVTSPRPVLAW